MTITVCAMESHCNVDDNHRSKLLGLSVKSVGCRSQKNGDRHATCHARMVQTRSISQRRHHTQAFRIPTHKRGEGGMEVRGRGTYDGNIIFLRMVFETNGFTSIHEFWIKISFLSLLIFETGGCSHDIQVHSASTHPHRIDHVGFSGICSPHHMMCRATHKTCIKDTNKKKRLPLGSSRNGKPGGHGPLGSHGPGPYGPGHSLKSL